MIIPKGYAFIHAFSFILALDLVVRTIYVIDQVLLLQ